jgi:hypothetical protein
MKVILESLKTGQSFDKNGWELRWVSGSGITPVEPYPDPLAAAVRLVDQAIKE